METGLGLKVGYIHTNMNCLTDIYFRFEHQKGIFVEPSGFFRCGGPKLKFHAALGFCRLFQITDNTEIHWGPFNLGIGISYSFGGISNRRANRNLNE